jgi:ribonuclease Y
MTTLILPFVLGFFVALFLGFLIAYLNLRSRRKLAEIEAEEMVRDAELASEMQLKALEENAQAEHEEALEEIESEVLAAQERFESAQEEIDQKVLQFETAHQRERRKLQSREDQLRNIQRRQESHGQTVQRLTDQQSRLTKSLSEELEKRVKDPHEALIEEVTASLKQEAKNAGVKKSQWIEQNAEVQAEREAKRILALVLNRFARPYCSERGIQSVHFADEARREALFGGNAELKAYVEKVCGVDIVFHPDSFNASIMGFDPVRRELGRLVLEALTREKNINEGLIDQITDRSKKQLFKKILKDGNKIAQELRIRDFHESIRSMLGALRYRYSYSQNQYFHVGEVGWLCGLMSAELGLDVEKGRRSGVLHDIGKAMDHSKEGGHAVIGAEFIQENGESPEVVHAVRAHHYDEQPSTDLAYLTIAADAISGARPGARRSTVDSYTQKMADLEKIGNSFREVQATYILSAGREVRLFVNSHHVDDQKAMELSKKVAQKIEDECNYPGMIKVTVVRQTQAVEYAQ